MVHSAFYDEDKDDYSKYRTMDPEKEIVAEWRRKTEQSLNWIRNRKKDEFIEGLLRIVDYVHENDRVRSAECTPGPTGQWMYQLTWIDAGISEADVPTDDADHIMEPVDEITQNEPKRDPSGKPSLAKRAHTRFRLDDPSQSDVVVDVDIVPGEALDLIGMSLSVDESLVAYIFRDVNRKQSQIWIREIATGKRVKLIASKREYTTVEFGTMRQNENGNEEHSLFFVKADASGRPCKVFALPILPEILFGSNDLKPEDLPQLRQIYESNEPKVHVEVQRTKGCQMVAINARSLSENEIYLVEHATDELKLVRKQSDKILYHIDVGKNSDVYLFVQGQMDPDKDQVMEPSLYQCSTDDLPMTEGFGTAIAGSALRTFGRPYSMVDFDIFQDFCAFYEVSMMDGIYRIRVMNRKNGEESIVPLLKTDIAASMIQPAGNMFYEATKLLFFVENPVTPRKMFEYDMITKQMTQISEPSSNDRDLVQRRILVPSKDETMVPLSIIHKKQIFDKIEEVETAEVDWEPDDEQFPELTYEGRKYQPCVLMVYGAYGKRADLSYDPTLQRLLDLRFVICIAHTRGGGDLGVSWHMRGRGEYKHRGVEDFIACATAITDGAIVEDPKRIVMLTARAFSAGAIIVAAARNRRPDLFKGVTLLSPFLDLDATMRNKDLPLTEHELDEFAGGDPTKDSYISKQIKKLCPCLNANNTSFHPRTLLIAAKDDEKVPYWNSIVYLKRVEKRYRAKIYLYLEEDGGGHDFGDNRGRVAAIESAFIVGASIPEQYMTPFGSARPNFSFI
jgi:protease II